VRVELDDLTPADLDDLLEDLEQHLVEVAAEAGEPLTDRLGAPESYAAELRASAGLPARHVVATGSRRQRVLERVTATSQWHWLAAFAPELRPGWWVLRGYLAVTSLLLLTDTQLSSDIPLPRMGDSRLLGLCAVAAGIAVSVWVGRRSSNRTLSVVAIIADVVVVIAAVAGIVQVRDHVPVQYITEGSDGFLRQNDGSVISNIWPYTTDGRPLDGVLLFDQNGRLINNVFPDGPTQPTGVFPDKGLHADPQTGQLVPASRPIVVLPPAAASPTTTSPSTAAPPTSAVP
jgi:hypothetical protein